MSSLVQLICCCQSGRTGTDDGNFLPVRTFGICGPAYPSLYAVSMIPCSLSRTDTGSPQCPQVHAFSHRAGHTREVNSGKLLSCADGYMPADSFRYKADRSTPVPDCAADSRKSFRQLSYPTDRTGHRNPYSALPALLFFFGKEDVEFIKIFDSFLWFHRTRLTSVVFHKSCWLSIVSSLLMLSCWHKMPQSVPALHSNLFLPSERLPSAYG